MWFSLSSDEIKCWDFILKGQCHEILDTSFFDQKTPPGPHMNRHNGFAKFFAFAEIFAKNMCTRMRTLCQRSQWQCGPVSACSTTALAHGKLFYIGKSKKLPKKVTKNVIIYFQICVEEVSQDFLIFFCLF